MREPCLLLWNVCRAADGASTLRSSGRKWNRPLEVFKDE
jgi:hypothetical protein